MKTIKLTLAFIFLVCNLTVNAQFTEAGGTGALKTVTGSSSFPDKTTELRNLINDGEKNIAITGNITLSNVKLQSNTHINVSPGVIIKLKSGGRIIFDVGVTATNTVSNVKIDCSACSNSAADKNNASRRFTMDLSSISSGQNAVAVRFGNAYNFRLGHFIIKDNYTKINAVTLVPALTKPSGSQPLYLRNIEIKGSPKKGDIKYGHLNKGHIGYGLIQVQSAGHVQFSNLSSVGGVALRFETGSGIANIPSNKFPFTGDNANVSKTNNIFGGVHNVVGTNISCSDGWSAVTMSPHGRKNGKVTINGASATGCASTIRIISGFKDKALNGLSGFPTSTFFKGSFGPVIIKGAIKATSANKAQMEARDYGFYPGSFKGTQTFEQKFPLSTNGPNFPVEGGGEDSARINCPSLANVLYTARSSANAAIVSADGDYAVTFQNPSYTNTGFGSCIENVLYIGDKNQGCRRVGNTGGVGLTPAQCETQCRADFPKGPQRRACINACNSSSKNNSEFINNALDDEQESESLVDYKLYPNPATDKLRIDYLENSNVQIYSYTGLLVKTIKNIPNKVEIDISTLQSGLYLVRIELGAKVYNKKLIIN